MSACDRVPAPDRARRGARRAARRRVAARRRAPRGRARRCPTTRCSRSTPAGPRRRASTPRFDAGRARERDPRAPGWPPSAAATPLSRRRCASSPTRPRSSTSPGRSPALRRRPATASRSSARAAATPYGLEVARGLGRAARRRRASRSSPASRSASTPPPTSARSTAARRRRPVAVLAGGADVAVPGARGAACTASWSQRGAWCPSCRRASRRTAGASSPATASSPGWPAATVVVEATERSGLAHDRRLRGAARPPGRRGARARSRRASRAARTPCSPPARR